MATDLGKVGIVAKGTWSSSATYEELDAVYYNNGTYIAKQAVPANTPPSSTTYWQPALTSSYIGINCNNIEALTELLSLITLPTQVGFGQIGTSEDTNIKTLIGQPFSQAYICCFIRLIGLRTDAAIYELTATRENSNIYQLGKNIYGLMVVHEFYVSLIGK